MVGESAWQNGPLASGNRVFFGTQTDNLITGLAVATSYEIRVRAILDGVISPASGVVTESTLENLFALYMEAECVESFSPVHYALVEDASVSNGQYFEVLIRDGSRPPAPERIIQFPFEVTEADTYYFYTRAYGQGGSNDSMHYAVNDDPYYSFGFCCTRWMWSDQMNAKFLQPVSHVLKIANRELEERLDKILITNSPTVPLSIGPIGENCFLRILSRIDIVDVFVEEGYLYIEFNAEAGKSYGVEVSETMKDGDWTAIGDSEVLNSPGGSEFIDVFIGGDDRNFVRVIELQDNN